MFDLDNAILEWKRLFQQNCSIADESLEELESHLRESVAELQCKGLTAEEGFMIAIKRLGHGPTLQAEFKKNFPLGENRDRLVWMLSGYLAISLCGLLLGAFISSLSTGMAYAGVDSTITGVVTTILQVSFWIAVFILATRAPDVAFIFGKKPALSLILFLVVMITLPFFNQVIHMASVRVADPKWMAETYSWIGFTHFVVQLFIYATCFFVLFKMRLSHCKATI